MSDTHPDLRVDFAQAAGNYGSLLVLVNPLTAYFRVFLHFFFLPLKTAGIFPYQDIPAFSFSPVFHAALRLYGKDRPVAGI
jgi:hypothetical protein